MCRGIYNSGLEKYRVVTLQNVSWYIIHNSGLEKYRVVTLEYVSWYIQGAARHRHGWRVHLGDDMPLVGLDVVTEHLVSLLVLVVREPADQVDLCCHHAAVDAADLR